MVNAEAQVELFRRQIQRILASAEFAHSRQLRDYLAYVSEAAFEGRTQLEQVEIAERVLHRGKDFNPVDDASVRKLATLLRQKLDRYYGGEGAADEIAVALPTRSYIPLFEFRRKSDRVTESELLVVEAPSAPATAKPRVARWRVVVGVIIVIGLFAAAAVSVYQRLSPPVKATQFVFYTAGGDIMHRENNLQSDALRLGPVVGLNDQVTVRMRFTPERATQQAGILVYVDADEYVKLGRQFNSRTQLEFGVETGGTYRKPVGTFVYDPLGQTDEPIWLSIRRNQSKFTAWISSDGVDWKKFGNELDLPGKIEPRVALFAHNGRADAPSTTAVFDHLSIGTDFYGLDAAAPLAETLAGWRSVMDADAPVPYLEPSALVHPFSAREKTYSMLFLRPIPAGDWTISTKLDFLSVGGMSAGLAVRGSRSNFRLIRWDLDGGSITAEHLGHKQANQKDFEGSPPVILRIRCQDGVLISSFSRDGVNFHTLPLQVPLAMLGDKIEYGIETAKSTWGSRQDYPPARFAYFHREVDQLVNHR